MKNYILILLFIFFVLINEKILKFYHVKMIYDNYNFIKFIVKNLLYCIPLITLYFNYDTILGNVKNNNIIKQNIGNNLSRNVNNTMKKYVASNQQWKCNMCNNLLDYSYEIDHIVPLYKNGNNNINNLQALCRNCHGKKTIIDRLN